MTNLTYEGNTNSNHWDDSNSLQATADFIEEHGFSCVVNNLDGCVNFQIPWVDVDTGLEGYECASVNNFQQARDQLGY